MNQFVVTEYRSSSNRGFQSVVFNSDQKIELRALYVPIRSSCYEVRRSHEHDVYEQIISRNYDSRHN